VTGAAPEGEPADVSGKSPAEVSGSASPPPPGRPVPTMPAQSGPAQPPVAAPPVKGFSLLLSVLWKRIRGLFRRRS
jgi:hypothetical protein